MRPTEEQLPDWLSHQIVETLKQSGLSRGSITSAIQNLSDGYIHRSEGVTTSWEKSETQIAYLAYFLPLNFVRLQHLFHELNDLGFLNGITNYVDFGSGPGTLSLLLFDQYSNIFSQGVCVERAPEAKRLFEHLRKGSPQSIPIHWATDLSSKKVSQMASALFVFSYSLVELEKLPDWFFDLHEIVVVEPSDRTNGRKILELRKELLSRGFHIWSPCTHQDMCPLHQHSKRDWCHQRVLLDQPEWFSELEKDLPMKNRSLTYSHLVASRREPPQKLQQLARITGDLLVEKGRSRQMFCQDSERRFLQWLKRDDPHLSYFRGQLISRTQLNNS